MMFSNIHLLALQKKKQLLADLSVIDSIIHADIYHYLGFAFTEYLLVH